MCLRYIGAMRRRCSGFFQHALRPDPGNTNTEAHMRSVVLSIIILAFSAAGGAQTQSGADGPLVFVAELQGRFVAPAAVDSAATGKATGVLVGNRFTVTGSFTGLSSALRDIQKKPDDPGVHLHRGAVGITTPYFHGLQVKLNADERSGIFYGTVTLTEEQLKALLAVETYIDIHTAKFGPGEVRDQWRPLDMPAALNRLQALGAHAPVEGSRCH